MEEIFVVENIVMVCDSCLREPKEMPSPKRKQHSAPDKMVQSTIDALNPVLSLSKTVTVPQNPTPSKPTTVKQGQQLQAVIETLVQKVEIQTSTIEGLKASVDTMKEAVSLQKVAVGESIRLNNENISSIKKTLDKTPNVNGKKSYAETAKRGLSSRNETPRTPKSSKPVMNGTSLKNIWKPPSPIPPRQQRQPRTMPGKAIWVSKMHRDISEEEMLSYVRDDLGIADDQLEVRKLVKKDRDICTYSFVSFCIKCSAEVFDTLMDVGKWPSYSQIREFELNSNQSVVSTGGPLPERNPPKNDQETSIVKSQEPEQTLMDTAQVTQ